MKKISEVIKKKELKTRCHFEKWDEKSVFYASRKIFQEEFGNFGARNFILEKYIGQKLYVRPQNSVWSSELWLNREKLTQKINEELGQKEIKEIKIIL